jgi:hypothetical protein
VANGNSREVKKNAKRPFKTISRNNNYRSNKDSPRNS